MDKHLEKVATAHSETKVLSINSENASILMQKLNVTMLPTIYCFKDGQVAGSIVGFNDLGGSDDFSTEDLVARLTEFGVLQAK